MLTSSLGTKSSADWDSGKNNNIVQWLEVRQLELVSSTISHVPHIYSCTTIVQPPFGAGLGLQINSFIRRIRQESRTSYCKPNHSILIGWRTQSSNQVIYYYSWGWCNVNTDLYRPQWHNSALLMLHWGSIHLCTLYNIILYTGMCLYGVQHSYISDLLLLFCLAGNFGNVLMWFGDFARNRQI